MKKTSMRALVVGGLTIASLSVSADTEVWAGGDKSDYKDESGKALSSFEIADFWSGGVPPTDGRTADYSYVIAADGDYAKLISGETRHSIVSDLTIGGVNNPSVTFECVSLRQVGGVYTNTNAAVFGSKGAVSLLGDKTVVKISEGFMFGPLGQVTIGSGVVFEGKGVIDFEGNQVPVAAHDYGDLWVQLGQTSTYDVRYTAGGDIATTSRLFLIPSGGGGIGGRTTLCLDGHIVTAGEVALGSLDSAPYVDGHQSTFGGISLAGGTLKVARDILFLGDPDGLKIDAKTPIGRDHLLTTDGKGGTLEIGGSLLFWSASDDGWYLRDLALVLKGDGKEQELELLTEDVGDTPTCLGRNTVYGSVTVKSPALVKLVDENDNDRRTPGVPEALYALDLAVEDGATLDLNGKSLYVYNEPKIEGAVLNGSVIRLRKAGFFSLVEHTLGTPGQGYDGTLGHWVGPMVAGDFDKDGTPELAVLTMDQYLAAQDDTSFHLLKFNGTTLTEAPNFPIWDQTILPGRTGKLITDGTLNPFMFEDLGDGKGARLLYTCSGWSDVISLVSDGLSAETLETSAAYGACDIALADLDGDGVKDIVSGDRQNGNNLKVWSVAKKQLLWAKTLKSLGQNVCRLGVADLDGDKKPEVLALAAGTSASGDEGNNLHIFKANGDPYVDKSGKELVNVELPYPRSPNGAGALVAKDITGDGIPEIFIVDTYQWTGSYMGYLLVTDLQGNEIFFKLPSVAQKGCSSNVQFFDLNDDRVCEFLYDGRIYSYSKSTQAVELIDTLPVPAGCQAFSPLLSPALVDMNGDQIPEIVYGCTDPAYTSLEAVRWIVAYDPVKRGVLDGFPVKLQYSQSTTENDWHAGNCNYWFFANIVVADLDGDKRWEIVVGVGVPTRGTTKRAALNIIKTPYVYEESGRRTQREIGAWQYGRGPLMDFTYPFARHPKGLAIILR